MKECFKCKQTYPLTEFYKHPRMTDGHLNKCKTCTKQDVNKNYHEHREKYAAYERKRFQRPERKAMVIRYQQTRRLRYPEKNRARGAVGNAIRDGRLARLPCQVCGDTNSQAHHHDYNKPLDVHWLCFRHHREAHGQTVLDSIAA